MVAVIALPTQEVGAGPVGVIVNVMVTGAVVVLVNATPVILVTPEALDAIPVTALVLSRVHAKVVPVTELLVPILIVVNELVEHIV
jgi:hypothetical protein